MPGCPSCGQELTWIPHYSRYYCFSESKYAPKEFGPTPTTGPAIQPGGPESHDGHYHCPTCGGELTYIAPYSRYYCYNDQKYAPKDIQPVVTAAMPEAAASVEEPTTAEPIAEEALEIALAPEEAAIEPEPDELAVEPAEPPPTVIDTPFEPIVAAQETEETVATVEAPDAQPEPGAEELEDEEEPETERPHLARSEVTRAKKSQLIEWANAYGLETTGTKSEVRDRLLEYMDEHPFEEGEGGERDEAEEEENLEEPQVVPEAAPPVEPIAPEGAVEPPSVVPATPEELAPGLEPETERSPKELPVQKTNGEAAPVEELMAPEAIETAPPEPAAAQASPTTEPELEPAIGPGSVAEPIEVGKSHRCPTCGGELTYIAQYNRLYCFTCGNYAPTAYGGRPAERTAAEPLTSEPFARETRAETQALQAPEVEARGSHPCPTCGRELTYIKEYDRWYCRAEGKYAPRKVANPCPTCGRELRYVAEYSRWYCQAEARYAPKTYVGTVAPARGGALATARVDPTASTVRTMPAVAAKSAAVTRTVGGLARGDAGTSVALAGFGFAVLLIPRILNLLATAGAIAPAALASLPSSALPLLEVLGMLLALAGVVLGLRALDAR